MGTNKHVPSSSICKYNLLRKADTSLGSLYCPWKVSSISWVQELIQRKCILYRKKANVYYKLERKWQNTMASARPIRAKFQGLESQAIRKDQENLKTS